MTAKTDSLTIEQAEQALAQARADRDELRERLIAGDTDVTDQDVAEADDRVVFAELKVEAAQEADDRRREHARRTRIGQIRSSLTDGSINQQAADLIELSRQARDVLDELYEAADRHSTEIRSALLELASLGDLPDDMHLDKAGAGGAPPRSVVIDGLRISRNEKLPSHLVVDAAYRTLVGHGRQARDAADDLSPHTGQVGAPGTSGTTRISVTEYLAKQYRLNGHGGS